SRTMYGLTHPDAGGITKELAESLAAQVQLGFYQAFVDKCKVTIIPSYGAPSRNATAQTALNMYVFGADPIGQQVQVLNIGSLQSPGRQLIISPITELSIEPLQRDGSLCFVL